MMGLAGIIAEAPDIQRGENMRTHPCSPLTPKRGLDPSLWWCMELVHGGCSMRPSCVRAAHALRPFLPSLPASFPPSLRASPRALRSRGWRRRTSGPSLSSSPSCATCSSEPPCLTRWSRTARARGNVLWSRGCASWSASTASRRRTTGTWSGWCSSPSRTEPGGSGSSPALFILPSLLSQQSVSI